MTRLRRRFVVLTIAVVLAMGLPAAGEAQAMTNPYAKTVRFTGYGWGHGWGMSQYGAHGAAVKGLSWTKILGFYYPGTTLSSLPSGQQIRIWLTADNDANLTVVGGVSGLRLRATANNYTYTFPTTLDAKQWRITRSGDLWQLHRLDSAGTWHKASTGWLPSTGSWLFENTRTGVVRVVLPGNATRDYRGTLALMRDGSALRTVNTLPMDSYLRGVVPAEMPASWPANAVRAQAVAARTYAAKRLRPGQPYDLCDTTTCQVYKGVAGEHPGGDAAISATARRILTYSGRPIDALFSSSNGGHTVYGGQPYLPAKPDPYDGVVRNQVWTSSATTAEIGKAFGIGTMVSLTVYARDGKGRLGGRVTSVRIGGTSGTVTVSGATLRARLGLRSELVRITAGLAPGSPTYTKWMDNGGPSGWMGIPNWNGDEQPIGDGSRVALGGATIYRSAAHGVHEVHGAIRTRYDALGGPAKLGMPTTDETVGRVSGVRKSSFAKGEIYWSSPTGARALWGPVLSKYRSSGAEKSVLGLPLNEPVTSSGVTSARFQHGTISCRDTACTVTRS